MRKFVSLIPILFLMSCSEHSNLSQSTIIDAKQIISGSPFMPGIISTPQNEYNLSTSDDNKIMVFARSDADFKDAHIMVMTNTKKGWSEPVVAPFSIKNYSDSDPWISPDGKWLYFVSDRPSPNRDASRKDRDIWRIRHNGAGNWGVPEYINNVNSEKEELGPELHNNILYFNSSRKGGIGGLDIYSAKSMADGNFEKPILLPEPINSPKSEGDFTLSRDNKRAYFWSTRSGEGTIYTSVFENNNWSQPVALNSDINIGQFNFTPSISADGKILTYASTHEHEGQKADMADIYLAKLQFEQ